MWLGESLGFWLQTAGVLISAIAAVYVIRSNGKQARMRATIDLVLAQKKDEQIIEARKKVLALTNTSGNLARHLDDPASEAYKAIQITLNNYEFIATGIRQGAFDEAIYKRMRYSIVCNDWRSLKAFVIENRNKKQRPTLYQEFNWLGERWIKKPLKADSQH